MGLRCGRYSRYVLSCGRYSQLTFLGLWFMSLTTHRPGLALASPCGRSKVVNHVYNFVVIYFYSKLLNQ